MTRLRRCPACRLAGREGYAPLITGAAARPGETLGVRVSCPHCLCTGPNSPTVDEAVAAWNALSRAAKRGMRAHNDARAKRVRDAMEVR